MKYGKCQHKCPHDHIVTRNGRLEIFTPHKIVLVLLKICRDCGQRTVVPADRVCKAK